MKQEQRWVVYFYDDFGAERKAGAFSAKSKGHAMEQARKQGFTKVCDALPKAQ